MSIRRLAVGGTSFGAVGLATIAVAWACSGGGLFPSADMTLSPNNGVCPLTSYPNSCPPQSVSITGTGFMHHAVGSTPAVSVGSVELFWLDEPFFAAGLGGPGDEGQQADADVCKTKGVRLTGSISVNATGGFGPVSVSVPPSASTYNDGTIRPVKAYYGANAVCAVWLHDLPGTADDHDGAVGNQYTLYPI